MSNGDNGVWTGHLIHRWTKWMMMEVSTVVTRTHATGEPTTRTERMETLKYRTCEICGTVQEGR